jgi:hypothetical protein
MLVPSLVHAQDQVDREATPETEEGAEQPAESNDREIPARIRVRSDTVMRFQSGYVFTVDESFSVDANTRYWQRVAQLPLYERVSLDARDLANGRVDVHFSGWGALDLTFPSDDGIAAGDFAIGYVEGRHGVASAWGGRRFLAWGIPGGVHLDGGGAAIRLGEGLVAEAAVGRPVTPRRSGLLGQRPDYSMPTLAYGARIGYSSPGHFSGSLSYLDRFAEGISADRSLAADALWRIVPEVDLSGNVSLDINSVGIEQASLLATFLVTDALSTDLGWQHVDPTRLLPMWSILAAFASSIFDEVAGGATLRVSEHWSLRGVAGLRVYSMDGATAGYRFQAIARYVDVLSGLRAFVSLSRRDDSLVGLNVLHGSVALPPLWERVIVALQLAVGVDDEAERESLLTRFSADWPVEGGFNVGASLDWARSPIVESELRGQLSFSYRPEDAE